MSYRIRQQVTKAFKKLLGYDQRALARLRPEDRALVERIKARKLTYLSNSKLESVIDSVRVLTEEDTANVHKRYDNIQKGASKGIGGDKYYGYEDNLYEMVQSNLAEFGTDCNAQHVELIKGLLRDTMIVDGPVAFAHIDVDWYEPVKVSLERIVPNLPVGGVLIIDDYRDWGGCKQATDEYFAGKTGDFDMDDSAGSLKITRLRAV